ncbi:methylenetetrahydrofolate--tRNA-(uracil(54)-C(5))-methyltransferase (FADH(2)-oxidizing) TrmFO [Dehalobacterium formicoaceticum]|uniref:methylenetetrahydrofolate--tRNA-(uracil(54)- C(5))-methyltransferase (FADH(2)-oxidizing) TrmFO n=1 Tax=Dehalobacterium formicoaceticum TaxID=51515 RepID=UPI000B7C924E|nr:methylenetetrahydrofolate--tRNA-(uracil(54)-C(5))-methyltransferase (FADH(2)-oxidizing) TrmFO [Dehalobacterium formicoaceticum]
MPEITIIGAGLAGAEAAWQAAERGAAVKLIEMRPEKKSPVHHSGDFAELVCSNSLRAANIENAVGLLKEEMRRCRSLIMTSADQHRVPAGGALAVDREGFAHTITEKIENHPRITVMRQEAQTIPGEGIVILASGPLTSAPLAREIGKFLGTDYLYFHDAVAPIVTLASVNQEIVFRASRYGKGEDDYLNCPMTEEEYDRFYEALINGEVHAAHEFEQENEHIENEQIEQIKNEQAEKIENEQHEKHEKHEQLNHDINGYEPIKAGVKEKYFEGCMPVEEMARRGRKTLAFGPLKPVGLTDPRTGKRPYAVVQLRQDNAAATLYNLVGFQTHLRWSEQRRIFSMIPGLAAAEFVRYGVMHRNTYINSPQVLLPTLQSRKDPRIFFAGQITGVEGYVESAAAGLVAGINGARLIHNREPVIFPRESALGSLCHYITTGEGKDFQPMNINFGIMPSLEKRIRDKKEKNRQLAERSLAALEQFIKVNQLTTD